MEEHAWLLDVDYTIKDNTPVLRLFMETEDSPLIGEYRAFRPYLYAILNDRDAFEDQIEQLDSSEHEFEIIGVEDEVLEDRNQDVDAIKVYTAVPPQVPKAKDELWSWDCVEEMREFDIPFYKRFLVNNGLRPPGPISVEGEMLESDGTVDSMAVEEVEEAEGTLDTDINEMAFDLEVYDDQIIMCSLYSDDTEKLLVVGDQEDYEASYVEAVADEKTLLERLHEIIDTSDPGIIVGYNTDEYDFDVLRDRCQAYDMELKLGRNNERMKYQRRGRFSGATVKGRIHLDLYAFVETVVARTIKSETLDLDSVAAELLGEAKEDMDWEDIKEAWREQVNLDKLASYALKDAELAYRLSESLTPEIMSLSQLTGMVPFDTCRTSYGQLVENFLIREAYREGRLVPNRPGQKTIGKRHSEGAYTGGFVYEPEEGLHDEIALFDFRSLYPTIIVSHNISPDTLGIDDCDDELEVEIQDTDRSYTFCQDTPGFIPSILEDLVGERYEIKDRLAELDESAQEYRNLDNRQGALKILSNSFYGYLGYSSARWYSRGCAEATTALGRRYIHESIEIAEEMGFEVVYGDTDSVLIKGNDIEAQAKAFQERVNDTLPSFMELELEGMFRRGLFTYTDSGRGAKKKYALLKPDGSVKITGFEQVRRDWSKLAKETQKKVIEHVLQRDVEGAVKVVEETIQRLNEGDVPLDQLKIYTGMTKKPESYDSKAPHVEAAKKAKERGMEISSGDTIDYVVTRGPGTISDRAEVTKYADDYDPEYYIDKQVIPVSLRVLKVFGYTAEQLKGKGKQSGLGKFT